MKTRLAIRRTLAFGIALTLTLCVPSAAQSTRTAAKSFLWKVQSGTGVLYLAGSIHALSADIYPLDPAFDRAFDASGTLVEEIDLGDSGQLSSSLALLGKGVFQDGRTFDQVVSRETAALVTERLKDTVPAEVLKSMKPWMIDVMLTAVEMQKEGLDPNLGLDRHFFDKATAAGKPVIGLETAESQIDRLDRMPAAIQEQMLRSTLEELDTQRTSLKAIVDAWRRGEASSLEQSLLAGFKGYRAVYDSLIVERNRNWMPQLDACLSRPRPCFVVVGAAHLVGPDGLLTMLRSKGYRLEQQ